MKPATKWGENQKLRASRPGRIERVGGYALSIAKRGKTLEGRPGQISNESGGGRERTGVTTDSGLVPGVLQTHYSVGKGIKNPKDGVRKKTKRSVMGRGGGLGGGVERN